MRPSPTSAVEMPTSKHAGYSSSFGGTNEFATESSGKKPLRQHEPLLMGSGNTASVPSNNNSANSWLELLSEVREQKSSSRYAKRNIVLLGDHRSGKSALVASLRHGGGVSVGPNAVGSGGAGTQQHVNNEHANLILMGHNWLAFKDDVRDETLHVDVWSIDHPNTISVLFEYGITNHEEEFPNTMFCFVDSMSRPWMALERLQVWFFALQTAVAQLKLDPSILSAWEHERELDFINFREQQQQLQQAADKSSAIAAAPLNMASGILGPRTLTVQSGLNLFVIITKSDYTVTLEREHNWRDQHFDYLQLALRQWCLAHGASLVYTSARTGKNIGLLLNYISSRLIYSYFSSQKRIADGSGTAMPEQSSGDGVSTTTRRAAPALQFTEAAHILEKDDVFVPLGWDSDRKIDVLLDSINLATGGKKSTHSHHKAVDNVDAEGDEMVDANGVPNVGYFENLLVPVQLRKTFQQQKEYRANDAAGDATPTPDKSQQNQRFQDEEQQFLAEIRQLLEASSAAAATASTANAAADGASKPGDSANGENISAESADMLNSMLEGGGANRPMSAGNSITGMTPAKQRASAGSSNIASSASVAALAPMGSVGTSTDKAVSMFFEECLRKKPTMGTSDLTGNPALK